MDMLLSGMCYDGVSHFNVNESIMHIRQCVFQQKHTQASKHIDYLIKMVGQRFRRT